MTRFACRKTSPPLPPRVFWALLILLLSQFFKVIPADLPPLKYSVQASVTVQESPPQIRLQWPGDPDANAYTIWRRRLDAGWQQVGQIGGGQNTFTDGGVAVGTPYEYKLVKNATSYTGYDYLRAGIQVPAVDYRGRVVLVVENSLAGALESELNQLTRDLIGDGWTVTRQTASRDEAPSAVRERIRVVYQSDPATRAVFLIGHVPVPYSGNIFPDGHPNHRGAWPADVYYGEMDGQWTDSSVDNTEAERQANWNVPGDGKFDQGEVPGQVELMVGRVDLSNMTCYSNKANSRSELDLMRQYFAKDHRWRMGEVQVEQRGLICDNFADKGDDPIAGSAWRAFPGFFGAENITEVPWDGYLPAATQGSWLWSYGSGGGTYYYSVGVGTADDFALQNLRVVFTMWMGSYFGDWNNESNFLRAALGSGDVLTSTYSGFPHTLYFPMGLGETTGYCIRLSQNNKAGGLYEPFNQGAGQVHVALHGDPTLRMHPVKPASNLSTSTEPGKVRLTWTGSSDSGLAGYHVYRAASAEGPFTRVTESPVSGTSYSDEPPAGTYTYMVRAIKLQESSSGSYFNPSQGITAQATSSGSVPEPPAAPELTATVVSQSAVDLAWSDVAEETGYELQRQLGSEWASIGSFGAGEVAHVDTGLMAGTEYRYRVRAFNDAGNSAYSSEVAVVTESAPEPQATVAFVRSESGLKGDWREQFGAEGYLLAAASWAQPAYLQVGGGLDAPTLLDADSSDPRALYLGVTGAQRIASEWHGSPLVIQLEITAEDPRQLAFYFVDWDRAGGQQQVTIRDAATGVVLDTREVTNFGEGQYLVYEIEGAVEITISGSSGSTGTLSGIFGGGAMVEPQALSLGITRQDEGEVLVRVEGSAGQRFVIEATEDYEGWTEIATGDLTSGSSDVGVEVEAGKRVTILRARLLP